MFYLTTHSTHFIYCYMTSDIWLRTILIVREYIYKWRLWLIIGKKRIINICEKKSNSFACFCKLKWSGYINTFIHHSSLRKHPICDD